MTDPAKQQSRNIRVGAIVLAILLAIPTVLVRAWACWIIGGWYGPLVHPAAVLSLTQCLGAVVLINSARALFTTNYSDDTIDIKSLYVPIVASVVVTGLAGMTYLVCVLPFK